MKDEADSILVDQKEANPKLAERTSQKYLAQYSEAMSLEDLSKLEFAKKELLLQIKQHLVYKESADQSSNLQIRVIRFTKRYECVQLQAKLGKFVFPNISLISISLESPTHSNRKIGHGGFSQIYSYKHSHNHQVVKCYPRKKWDVSQNILSIILNEYCLLKIASALKVGPKMKEFQGFDIIAYKDCFQFRMEHCNDPCEKASIDLQLLSDQLKENLLRLHAFNFIHNDIKVDNIAFSPFFNRYVFIDFNLSRIIRERIGFKTLTAFRGTPNYCSSEMGAIYLLQETRFVDLFYNDLFSLKESLSRFQENIIRQLYNQHLQSYFSEKSIIFAEQMTPQMCFTQLIFYIFRQDLNSIKYFDINPLSQRILGQIFTFLSVQPSNLKNRAIKELLLRKRKNTQTYDKCGQVNTNFNQSDRRMKIILKMLLSVNKDDVSEYYINQLRLQRKQEILDLFANKNTNITDIISLIDYMHIIAKAIQINSSPFTLQQAQQLCRKAITTLIKDERATINIKTDFLDDYLAYVSLFLFQQSLKNRLEGKYLKIFQEILVNVIVCKVVPISRINTIYEEVLSMKLSFQNKALLLLKIKNSILWQIKENSIIDNDCLFSTQNQLEKKILKRVLQQKKHTQKQLFILKIILNNEEYYNFHEISSSQCNDFGPKLINQLIIFELTKSFRLLSQTNDMNVSLLVECLQKRYQYDFTSFDRYQFKLIQIIMLEQDHTKLQKIYESYDNTFKFRREKGYKKLLKFYLEDQFGWQISRAKLQKKIKQLQEILPQVSNYEHMHLFKFVFLALRVHYDKIKTQCKEMIQIFYHFLTKLLSSFTIDNFIKNNIDPLNMIIEKLTFYEYFSKKGLKNDKYVYSRSHCYQDYMKIDLNALEYNQKCPILVNKLLALSKILYFFNKNYETMYVLTKIIRVHKRKPEKLQYILQFIFYKIFYRTNNYQSSSFLTNCALIYDQIVQKKEEQSIYLLKNILFDEILMVLFRSNQVRCAQLIKKMCNLVCLYPTHKNIRVYCDSIERFFEGNYFRQNFKMFYERLISSIDMNENPFYFIITYNGFKNNMIGDINTIYRQFVKCIPFFPIQLQGMFLSYLNIINIDENSLNVRKAIRFRFFSITLRQILRLFINEQSLLLMKLKKNHQKYVFLKNKMRTFLINPIRNMFKVFQNFACRWNKIYYSDLDTYKQAK